MPFLDHIEKGQEKAAGAALGLVANAAAKSADRDAAEKRVNLVGEQLRNAKQKADRGIRAVQNIIEQALQLKTISLEQAEGDMKDAATRIRQAVSPISHQHALSQYVQEDKGTLFGNISEGVKEAAGIVEEYRVKYGAELDVYKQNKMQTIVSGQRTKLQKAASAVGTLSKIAAAAAAAPTAVFTALAGGVSLYTLYAMLNPTENAAYLASQGAIEATATPHLRGAAVVANALSDAFGQGNAVTNAPSFVRSTLSWIASKMPTHVPAGNTHLPPLDGLNEQEFYEHILQADDDDQ